MEIEMDMRMGAGTRIEVGIRMEMGMSGKINSLVPCESNAFFLFDCYKFFL